MTISLEACCFIASYNETLCLPLIPSNLSLSALLYRMHIQNWRRKWQPTPVFLPGESQGWGSLVGCHPWGRTESDTTGATQQQPPPFTMTHRDNKHIHDYTLYCCIKKRIPVIFKLHRKGTGFESTTLAKKFLWNQTIFQHLKLEGVSLGGNNRV